MFPKDSSWHKYSIVHSNLAEQYGNQRMIVTRWLGTLIETSGKLLRRV